jgi:hypothetical protein
MAFVAVLAAAAAVTAVRSADQEIVVPLHLVRYTDGSTQLGIDVTFGTKTQRLLFDTGSTGLRILANALSADAFKRTGRSLTYGYGSGMQVEGEEANAALSIGAAHGTNVPIQVVDRVVCNPIQLTDCPKDLVAASDFAGPYPGIMGVYVRSPQLDCCDSPLYNLEGKVGRHFIVHANFDAPALILNPDTTTMKPFSIVDFEAFGAPRGCIRIYESEIETCGPVIFDTGSPMLLVTTTGVVPALPWTHATVRIGGWTHDFTVGATEVGKVPLYVLHSETARIVLGLPAMQQFDVFYDLDARRVGVVTR